MKVKVSFPNAIMVYGFMYRLHNQSCEDGFFFLFFAFMFYVNPRKS